MSAETLGARQELHRPPPPGGNGRAPTSIRGDGTGGAGQDPARFWQGLGRTLRLAVLLILIATALVATTFFDRGAQVLLLKASLVVFLSVLPGWLYLQFIALKGTVLYDEYVLNLYRLRIDDLANLPKPPPGSRYWNAWNRLVPEDHEDESVARNIYLKKFEAVYGRSAIPESRRQRKDDNDQRPMGRRGRIVEQIQADAFSPVIMSTILLCVGWVAVIQPEPYLGLRPFGDLTLSGFPDLPVEPLRFGFLGAYVFIVQGLVRRYFHSDLKTHAYVSAIARVILVAALVTAIHPLWSAWGLPPSAELAFAFFLGFFPELGLRVIQRSSTAIRSVTQHRHVIGGSQVVRVAAAARRGPTRPGCWTSGARTSRLIATGRAVRRPVSAGPDHRLLAFACSSEAMMTSDDIAGLPVGSRVASVQVPDPLRRVRHRHKQGADPHRVRNGLAASSGLPRPTACLRPSAQAHRIPASSRPPGRVSAVDDHHLVLVCGRR